MSPSRRTVSFPAAYASLGKKDRGFRLPSVFACQGAAVNYSINLQFNGTNGSTTFTDDSANNHTASVFGNAQISTAQSVSGGSSLLLDGTGDYLGFGPSSTFAMGTGDFEIAFDLKQNGSNSNNGVYDITTAIGGAASNAMTLAIVSPYFYLNGTNTVVAVEPTAWQRIRVARFGGNLRMAKDGTQVYSVAHSADLVGTYLNVGLYYSTSFTLNGYIDNFQIVKGGLIEAWPS
jgi:hypothetical protein